MSSYEFEFMAKFSMSLAKSFPEIIFLHPFHDGIAVAFKIQDRLSIEEGTSSITRDISNEVSFKAPIEIDKSYFELD